MNGISAASCKDGIYYRYNKLLYYSYCYDVIYNYNDFYDQNLRNVLPAHFCTVIQDYRLNLSHTYFFVL